MSALGICSGLAMTQAKNIWVDDRYVVAINAAMAVSKDRPRVEVEIVVFG